MTSPDQQKLTAAQTLGKTLAAQWLAQVRHNIQVKRVEERTPEEWTQTYILGIQHELMELLDEINWKVHRKGRIDWDSTGAMLELADITKYVFSLWAHFGCTPDDMVHWVSEKSAIVEHRFWHEWAEPLKGEVVLMGDLDGSLADWRKGFAEWATSTGMLNQTDIVKTLAMDLDTGWEYSEYAEARRLFEYSGGHATLPAFADGIQFVQEAQEVGAKLLITTARPRRPSRNFYDTYKWCKEHELAPEWIYFTENGRIAMALELAKRNKVIALEDNPDLAERYASNGILVIMRKWPYNDRLRGHRNIVHSDNFVQSAMNDERLRHLKLTKRWHHVR